MRRNLSIILLAMAVALLGNIPSVFAQGFKVTTIKLGYFNPKDTKSGFIIGTNFGMAVDENVDLGIGVDFFRKKYTQTSTVADTDYVSGIHESTVQKELEYTTHILPITATIHIKIPASYLLSYYIGGGIGYELLFNKEKNFVTGNDESRFYHGFNWLVNAGVIYQVGSRSALLGELFYNNAKVSRSKEENESGLPVWNEVNLSGLGVRFGVRLEFW